MYVCPHTGFKLKKARGRGGNFWYSKHSRGRLLSIYSAKHFLGRDGVREIWVRSQLRGNKESQLNCPSCLKKMTLVLKPKWLQEGHIDVCKICHLIWVEADTHHEIPHPEDLISEKGDSTLIADHGEAITAYEELKNEIKEEQENFIGKGPDSLAQRVLAFVGLPAEMSGRGPIADAWVSGFILSFCVLTFIFGSNELLTDFGYYPNQPLKNFGINIFFSPFLHGGWFHLIFNCYFFYIFSDDVEEAVGFNKFMLLIFGSSLGIALASTLISAHPLSPHVGLSGLVMSLMVFYALSFPKARLAYMLPGINYFPHNNGSFSLLRAWTWVRLPVWIVAFFYFGKDLLFYFVLERGHLGNTSHSSHLAGIACGVFFYYFFNKDEVSLEPSL